MAYRVLIIDDEPALRGAIARFLRGRGFEAREAQDVASGREEFQRFPPDCVVLDYSMPDGTALDLLPHFQETAPDVPVVILTGHGTIDLAVRAMKEGAENFLTKPTELSVLGQVVDRALARKRSERKELATRPQEHQRGKLDPFRGESPAIAALAEEAALALESDSPVLIQGETGTGKGVLARWIHEHGLRREEAFVDINCAGLNRELLESELFGHAKGSFTGAVADKTGLLEAAHKGTLFLDEIGDVEVAVQPKLLKVLEEKTFRRLGEVSERRVDVRLIAAANKDLSSLIREERFRPDLYFRLNTLLLNVPPLRDRMEDLPALAGAILEQLAEELKRGPLELAPESLDKLRRYAWPGNLRELRNVLERAVLCSQEARLVPADLRIRPTGLESTTGGAGAALTLEELERRHIEEALRQVRGHVVTAAERLDIPRSTLYQKLKVYGIDPADYKS
jgi:DNA-binding NtrC family response regulator